MAVKSNEAAFTISGKINLIIIISALSSLISIGGLFATVSYCKDRISILETKSDQNVEDHSKILNTLIKIETTSDFLKNNLSELKNRGKN